jgi:hypothetical protein
MGHRLYLLGRRIHTCDNGIRYRMGRSRVCGQQGIATHIANVDESLEPFWFTTRVGE